MPNLGELLKGKEASRLLSDTKKLEQLRDTPETQKVFYMLSRSAGDLEAAAPPWFSDWASAMICAMAWGLPRMFSSFSSSSLMAAPFPAGWFENLCYMMLSFIF